MGRPKTPEPSQLAQATAMVASAVNMGMGSGGRSGSWKKASWQDRAWRHYDACGELRYAVSWFANALSRATLHVVEITDGEPNTITEGDAFDALEALKQGAGGEVNLLKSCAQQFFVAGEWYLVGRDPQDETEEQQVESGAMVWEVVSTDEMKHEGTDAKKGWYIEYDGGDKIVLTDSDIVIRMWNAHPQKKKQADSPVRGNDHVLRQIEVLSKHTDAQVYSRLSGAGLLAIPSEMTFAGPTDQQVEAGQDPFLLNLMDTMAAAIADPGSPEALVPIVVKGPGEHLDKIRRISMWDELDQQTAPRLEMAIKRLALGLDMPPEVLLGIADVNHWGAWQVDESAIKAHIEPALMVICAGLTRYYLRNVTDAPLNQIITFDTSALRLRPNRSKEALELWDRGEIGGKALRRETGFEEQDAMEVEERKQWLLMKIASGSATPEMVAAALRLFGVEIHAAEEERMRETPDTPSLEEHPETGPPEPDWGEPEAAALLSACDVLVYRAMERAGNRLNNATKSRPPGIDPTETHMFIRPRDGQLGALLQDAWKPLPRLVGHLKWHPDLLAQCLDSYCKTLLAEQRPHTRTEMEKFISAGMKIL